MKRRLLSFIVVPALCVLASAANLWAATGTELISPFDLVARGWHHATVRYVVDGDTVQVSISKSQWIVSGHIAVRVDGIDTPEKTKINAKCAAEVQLGLQATAFAKTLLPPGTLIRFYPTGTDKYGGRVDARIMLPDGRDYAQVLLASGLARPYSGSGPKPNWCG